VGLGTGDGVGDAVGLGVGDGVGDAVGVAVGLGTGAGVGDGFGAGVGVSDGVAVGWGVGEAVGSAVGSAVGVGLGSSCGLPARDPARSDCAAPAAEAGSAALSSRTPSSTTRAATAASETRMGRARPGCRINCLTLTGPVDDRADRPHRTLRGCPPGVVTRNPAPQIRLFELAAHSAPPARARTSSRPSWSHRSRAPAPVQRKESVNRSRPTSRAAPGLHHTSPGLGPGEAPGPREVHGERRPVVAPAERGTTPGGTLGLATPPCRTRGPRDQ